MIGLLFALAVGFESVAQPADQEDVDVLRAERIELLRHILEINEERYRLGDAEIDEVSKAQQELLSAELEAADSVEERLQLLTAQVELAKRIEDIASAKFEQGLGTQIGVLQAKSARLKFAIELQKERDAAMK